MDYLRVPRHCTSYDHFIHRTTSISIFNSCYIRKVIVWLIYWLCTVLHRIGNISTNLTKVRPLLTLSHRGFDNSPLLIMSSAKCIDKSNRFHVPESISEVLTLWPLKSEKTTCLRWDENVNFIIFINTALRLNDAFWLVKIVTQSPNNKVYTKFTWTRSVLGSYQILYATA